MIYAFDSNIVSYFLRKDELIRSKFISELESNNAFIVPPLVYFEVKRWLVEKQAYAQIKEFDELCQMLTIGEMNIDAWNKAIDIYVATRKKGTPVDIADLLIAAFCIVNDCVLVTNNIRHFSVIDELQYVNWKSLN